MPTKRFSTKSTRPMALRAPISFSSSTSETASRRSPPTETGTPLSKSISTRSLRSGADGGDRNSVPLGIVQAILARLQLPLSPGRNDLQLRRQRLVSVLEAHLIVSLAGAAVGHSGCAFVECNLDLMFRDHGSGQRSPQQVLVFIHCSCGECGKHVVGQKLLAHVAHHDFSGAGCVGLAHYGLEIVTLANVGDHG